MFLNLYQRQCSNVLKFNTEAHVSLIFFQSNILVVFPEKELIFNEDFLQAGIYYILIFTSRSYFFLSSFYFQT